MPTQNEEASLRAASYAMSPRAVGDSCMGNCIIYICKNMQKYVKICTAQIYVCTYVCMHVCILLYIIYIIYYIYYIIYIYYIYPTDIAPPQEHLQIRQCFFNTPLGQSASHQLIFPRWMIIRFLVSLTAWWFQPTLARKMMELGRSFGMMTFHSQVFLESHVIHSCSKPPSR